MTPLPPKRNKYGNRRVTVDGIGFASVKEAARYGELKLLERIGEIEQLSLQPQFLLTVKGETIGKIVPDFMYRRADGALIVEDVKSKATITPFFRWKRKHLRAEYGISLEVVL